MMFLKDGIMFERARDERSISVLFSAVEANRPKDTYDFKSVPDLGEIGILAHEMEKCAGQQIARLLAGKAMDPTGGLSLGPAKHRPIGFEAADIGNRLRAAFNERGSTQPYFFLPDSEIPQAIDDLEKFRAGLDPEGDHNTMTVSRQLLDVLVYAQPEEEVTTV